MAIDAPAARRLTWKRPPEATVRMVVTHIDPDNASEGHGMPDVVRGTLLDAQRAASIVPEALAAHAAETIRHTPHHAATHAGQAE